MSSPYAQDRHGVRFDWGPIGADAIGPGAGGGDPVVVAVVDVLSFTTTLTVAAERGIDVFPYPFADASAADFARRHDAALAVGRSRVTGPGEVSLSPASIRAATGIDRLVLPSPNGSATSAGLAARGATVIGVCLRNASAAAAWTCRRLRERPDTVVAVIAAGERWHDGSLRPAVEDLWGAGAFIAGLPAGLRSREAATAAAVAEASGRFADLTRHPRTRRRRHREARLGPQRPRQPAERRPRPHHRADRARRREPVLHRRGPRRRGGGGGQRRDGRRLQQR